MKIIAIGDVHNHIKAAEAIAQKYEDTHKICLLYTSPSPRDQA